MLVAILLMIILVLLLILTNQARTLRELAILLYALVNYFYDEEEF